MLFPLPLTNPVRIQAGLPESDNELFYKQFMFSLEPEQRSLPRVLVIVFKTNIPLISGHAMRRSFFYDDEYRSTT